MSEPLVYRIPWRPRGARPGHHRARPAGAGAEFSHYADLLRAPDLRRFDVAASLRDPRGGLRFRVYRQSSAVPVWLLVDASASMGCGGKLRRVAELAESLAEAAWLAGDPFGHLVCGAAPVPDLTAPPRLQRGLGASLARRLRAHPPQGRFEDTLEAAAPLLGRQRALVLLVSDFHLPLRRLESMVAALVRHDVVPVVCWDEAEFEALPRWGWARLEDAETGRRRRLLVRPALRAAIQGRYRQRWEQLAELFRLFRRRPLRLGERFDPGAVTRYFHEA